MSRRIEIELTSRRDDGSWTWRAPGAREPRGSLDGELLPGDARVGDVLRAEADFEIDGIVVTSVHQKQSRDESRDDGRIEVVGSRRENQGGVSVVLARERAGRAGRGEGRDSADKAGDRRRERPGRRPTQDRAPREQGEPPEQRRRRQQREAGETPEGRRQDAGRRERPTADPTTAGRRQRVPGKDVARDRTQRKRVEPVTTHRNAALAGLGPEQLPVAEQLLRGGIPALRRAIEEQNTRARAEDRAEVSSEKLMSMAEELLPVLNLASWKDRAVAVRTAGRDAPLRETRAVVSAASAVNLDDEARELLSSLRESLESRVKALRDAWTGRITTALDEGRVTDALRVSSRPPEPGSRLTAELAVRLAEAASNSMSPELAEERWKELLDAVVESPVRRNVRPSGLPSGASDGLLDAARRAAGMVPELARLLGLPIPPPPGRRRPVAATGRRS